MLVSLFNRSGTTEFHRRVAKATESFETIPAVSYAARYERARQLFAGAEGPKARELMTELYKDSIESGFLPPMDGAFNIALQGNTELRKLIRETSAEMVSKGARPTVVYLAWQMHYLGHDALAEELYDAAITGMSKKDELPTRLAAVEYLYHTGRHVRAEIVLRPLLKNKRYAEWPGMWRLAMTVADGRGAKARAIEHLNRAMDIEYERLPDEFEVKHVRVAYAHLLDRYGKLATVGAMSDAQPSREVVAGVVRAADRWRSLDTDPVAACDAAAMILAELGAEELAWDYLTTPLAGATDTDTQWAVMARGFRRQGHANLAGQAYRMAFKAEPKNAKILFAHAEMLLESGDKPSADKLFRRIAEGKWESHYQSVQARAKEYLEEE